MHTHHPCRHGTGRMPKGRTYAWGIFLNTGFLLAEFAVGFCCSSMGLLADAGHNLSDVGSLVISMAAFLLARKHEARNYTYGYRKATILAALLNAVILLIAAGVIVSECILKLIRPEPVDGMPIILTAGIGIVVNGVTALLFLKDKDGDLNTKGAYWHMLADTLVSIGVVLSGIMILFTGWTILDPLVGLSVAVIILFAGMGLLKESLRLSLDGIPYAVDLDEIREHILGNRNVSDVHHLHIWALSTTENALTAHVAIRDAASLESTKKELHALLQEHGISHVTLEFELPGTVCPALSCGGGRQAKQNCGGKR